MKEKPKYGLFEEEERVSVIIPEPGESYSDLHRWVRKVYYSQDFIKRMTEEEAERIRQNNRRLEER